MSRPLVVVEGSDAAVDHARAELRGRGLSLVDGWAPVHGRGVGIVRVGTVATAHDAEQAVLAALDGVGLLVVARAERRLVDQLVDDLRRLGPVDHRLGEPEPATKPPPEAGELLGLLAEGFSLGEAAEMLGLARRTADRRLAAARRLLGVERTTEAIAIARRRGWLRRAPGEPRP